MKLIIDIDDKTYKMIKDAIYFISGGRGSARVMEYNALKAIYEGKPLPKGHWFVDERPESNREIICSNCEQPIFKYHKLDFDYRPKYCPNCGAKMIESEVDNAK